MQPQTEGKRDVVVQRWVYSLACLVLAGAVLHCAAKKSSGPPWASISAPISKPLNPADLSNAETAARGAKIATSMLRMFMSSYTGMMNQLLPALVFFNGVFKSIGTGPGAQLVAPPPGVTDGACEVSGTFHSAVTNTSSIAKHVLIDFHECKEGSGSLANGEISFDMEDPGFQGASPDDPGWVPSSLSGTFSNISFTFNQGSSTLQMLANFSMSSTGGFLASATGSADLVSGGATMASVMDGVMEIKGTTVVENTPLALDDQMYFDQVHIAVSGLMGGLTISGGWRMQDNVEPANSFEAVFENVGIRMDVNGDAWTQALSPGSVLDSKCLNGSAGIQTLQNIQLTFPQCPTTGVIELTAAGKASVSFTSQGGVNIDVGETGNVTRSFPLCESPSFTACGWGGQ